MVSLTHLLRQSWGAPGPHISNLGRQIFVLDEPFKASFGASCENCSDMTPGPYPSDLVTQIPDLDGPFKSMQFPLWFSLLLLLKQS